MYCSRLQGDDSLDEGAALVLVEVEQYVARRQVKALFLCDRNGGSMKLPTGLVKSAVRVRLGRLARTSMGICRVMTYRVLRAGGSRIGHLSCAVLGAAGLLWGCDDVPGVDPGDAGPDAAVGYVSDPRAANTTSDDESSDGEDTQTIDVNLGNQDTTDEVLSVGLDGVRGDADAGLVEGGVVDGTAPTSEPGPVGSATSGESSATGGTGETTGASGGSGGWSTGGTGGWGTGELPLDSTSAGTTAPVSGPTSTTSDVPSTLPNPTSTDGISSDVPTTLPDLTSTDGATSSDVPTTLPDPTSTDGASSSSDETSDLPPPLFPGRLTATGDWVDLPATFMASVDVGSNRARFSWEILTTPPGSELTTRDLEGNTTYLATFYPDVAGQYTARVTLTVGDANYVGEVSVQIEAVDVGFISIKQDLTSDTLAYTHSPQMVRSDRPGAARQVGCAFQSDPNVNWYNELGEARQRTFGFRYPRVPSETTQFAYRMAQRQRLPATSQVATPDSDCERRAPKDLPPMWTPSFSPEGKHVAFVQSTTTPNGTAFSLTRTTSDGSETALLSSPFDLISATWWEPATWKPEAVVWLGAQERANYGLGVVDPFAAGSGLSMMGCSNTGGATEWSDFEMGPDFVLGNSYGDWWYLPVQFSDNGPYVSCNIEDARPLPPLYDVAVSPDGKSLAMITLAYSSDESVRVQLEIGPVATLFEGRVDWVSVGLDSEQEYTGLHWIAGNKQLVWTAFDVVRRRADLDVFQSSISRVNSDGKRPKELVRAAPDTTTRHVFTTGPLPLSRYLVDLETAQTTDLPVLSARN